MGADIVGNNEVSTHFRAQVSGDRSTEESVESGNARGVGSLANRFCRIDPSHAALSILKGA